MQLIWILEYKDRPKPIWVLPKKEERHNSFWESNSADEYELCFNFLLALLIVRGKSGGEMLISEEVLQSVGIDNVVKLTICLNQKMF